MSTAVGVPPLGSAPPSNSTRTTSPYPLNTAPASGVLQSLDAYAVGVAAWRLGAGRARKEDPVQAGAGVEMHAKPGDSVTTVQPLLTLHTDTPERFDRAVASLEGAWTIGEDRPERPDVVMERIA